MQRQRRKLTVEDRVAIDLRRQDGWGVRAIARELGRSPSVISAELGRGRDTDGHYAAGPAQAAAAVRWDRSGRQAKLAPDSPLFAEVAELLRLQWSPEQTAGRRKRLEDGTEVSSGLRVRRSTRRSTPCRAVSCSPACVRASRIVVGGPRMANGGAGSATSSANGRRRWRVPGHWEGDLIKGAGNRSSVGTLVERTSRKLIKLMDAKAETARDGFAAGLLAVPASLRLTLTDDQGKEMARHKELAALTGLHAPWQRGSNENA